MSQFPALKSGAVVQYPAIKTFRYSTETLRFLDGSEQRYRQQSNALRRWLVRLEKLTDDEMERLEQFFIEQDGSSGSFTFHDPWEGTDYDDCSFESDDVNQVYEGFLRGSMAVWIRQNRS